MEIAIKNVLDDKLRKDFQMNIPSQLINQKINDYIVKIQAEFSMEGFEKGKVPAETIKEKYGKSIMAEQSDILISEAISKIVNDNKYKIASYPKIEFKTFEEGKDYNEALRLITNIQFDQNIEDKNQKNSSNNILLILKIKYGMSLLYFKTQKYLPSLKVCTEIVDLYKENVFENKSKFIQYMDEEMDLMLHFFLNFKHYMLKAR